ncbi:MAG: hypothetical protein Q9183_006333, partial [Haloplaca sp. 2 TL-2023]
AQIQKNLVPDHKGGADAKRRQWTRYVNLATLLPRQVRLRELSALAVLVVKVNVVAAPSAFEPRGPIQLENAGR